MSPWVKQNGIRKQEKYWEGWILEHIILGTVWYALYLHSWDNWNKQLQLEAESILLEKKAVE